jgi:hypothetical protein
MMKKTDDAPEGYVYAPWIPVTTKSFINGIQVWDRRWWKNLFCKINWFFHFRMRKRHNKWRRSEVKVGRVMHFAQFPGEQTSNNK